MDGHSGMSGVEVDLSTVNEALLDQVRELSGRLARSTAVIMTQQQHIADLERMVSDLSAPQSMRPPEPSG